MGFFKVLPFETQPRSADHTIGRCLVLDQRETQPLSAAVCRAMDVLFAAAGLIFLLPIFVLLAAAIRLQDGGASFYAQPRLGRHGRTFRCLKFRTMVTNSEQRLAELLAKDAGARAEWEADRKLRRDPRITGLGRFLRASSLDELPQLINILRGEMSLVGPRPIVEGERRLYGRHFKDYAAVRPGLTGLWQVSGRNEVSYRRRVAMDVLYVRRRSVLLYFRILIATAPAVLLRTGY